MPVLGLLLIFVTVPLLELYVILQVGDAIGVVPTILLLAADSLLGAILLRRQGRSVWRSFIATMGAGRVPHRELQDGVAVIFGGAFLITPGFLTDVLGLALLLPPSRRAILRIFVRRFARRFGFTATVEGTATERRPSAPSRPPRIEP